MIIGLLKTLAILAFIYYAIKFVSPYLKRYAARKVGEHLEDRLRRQFRHPSQAEHQHKADKRKEGEVRVEGEGNSQKQTVNPASKSNKYNTSNMGEYIDFEEVKD